MKDSSLLFSPGIVEYGIIIGDFLRTVDLNKPNLTESFVDTVLGKRVIDLISKQACGFRPFYNLGIFTSAIKIGADIADIIHYQAKKNEYRPKPAPLVTNCSAVLCKLGVKPELVENYLAAR